jgi:spoIIIJ-associated protein
VAHAEASARTVESAVATAAAELGLRPDQVEVEVIEEAVPSTFGVIGSPARVRVTPRGPAPAVTPSASDQPDSAPGATAAAAPGATGAPASGSVATADPGPDSAPSSSAAPATGGAATATTGSTSAPSSVSAQGGTGAPEAAPTDEAAGPTDRPPRREHDDEPVDIELVEADTELAGDFLEGLLDAMDVDGDITTWIDERGGHIELEGQDLDALVGPDGETLDALQELTRLAVLRQTKRRARVFLDVNAFRAHRREQLTATATAAAKQVLQTREDHEFQPMTPAERKVVHDAVAAVDGARTESLGEEPHRRVVIRPA